MLQMMMNKIEAEGKKEEELFDKFMCYCKTGEETLGKSIEDANTKIPQLESDIKAGIEEKKTLEGDVEAHQGDRDAAKQAMAKASEIREKEGAAITKGMAGGFLQTSAAAVLRKLTIAKVDMLDIDRQELVAFLSGTQEEGYVPKSAEILGILKQMKDEMEKDLADAIAAEASAAQTFEELMAAKKKEVEALTKAIEEKLTRIGELGVEIVTMKNDLEDTQEALAEDTQFLADLKKTCAMKAKEWEERCKTRSEELLALHETIKILNDDDALELFKKTLPRFAKLVLRSSLRFTRPSRSS